MSVVERDVPRHSALGKALIERADFRDAYRAPLSRSDLDVVDIFFGIFGHRPGWMNLMLIARNKVAGLSWPGGSHYLGNIELGKERPLLCRREDRTLANLFSRL